MSTQPCTVVYDFFLFAFFLTEWEGTLCPKLLHFNSSYLFTSAREEKPPKVTKLKFSWRHIRSGLRDFKGPISSWFLTHLQRSLRSSKHVCEVSCLKHHSDSSSVPVCLFFPALLWTGCFCACMRCGWPHPSQEEAVMLQCLQWEHTQIQWKKAPSLWAVIFLKVA